MTKTDRLFLSIKIIVLSVFAACTALPAFSQTQQNDLVAAIVNGKTITNAEVDSLVPKSLSTKPEALDTLRKVALDNAIINLLLKDEAKRRNITLEALRKQLTQGIVSLPAGTVQKEYEENRPFFALMSPDEAKERIRLRFENEARMNLYRIAVSKLKARAKIEIRLKGSPRSTPSFAAMPFKGNTSAKVTIVEFSDFRCPYCRESEPAIKQVLEQYKEVKFIYKHLPLQQDDRGLTPAIGSYCGNAQGRFWEFHQSLFQVDDLSRDSVVRVAKNLDLDIPAFEKCLGSDEARAAVLHDLNEAVNLGISGTPTFVINGKVYRGKLGLEDFKGIIELELSISKPVIP